MPLKRIEHYNVHTTRLNETVAFYDRVLGMKAGDRPPFPFPGAWIYLGDTPVLHLVDVSGDHKSDRAGQHGTGALDHIAFEAVDLPATKAKLTRENVAFQERIVPRTGITQLFVEDPNGLTLELNFAETATAR
ncbi:MAG: VOC family protein [Hyphomicrobiales bacterium]|nr:VOC family protein [Hyphomicrobiales bacterium]